MNIERLLQKWSGREGGAERANYAMFLIDLANALGLPCPEPADSRSTYRFEYPVDGDFGQKLRIDLYKENSFILEAKQSRLAVNPYRRHAKSEAAFQEDLFGNPIAPEGSGRRLRWAADMDAAFRQARDYAQRLAPQIDRPPFLITCDVGRSFEFYADFSGQGRAYRPFVSRDVGRRVIELKDLVEPDVQALCSPGIKLHGAGFIINRAEALTLGLGRPDRNGLEAHIRPYLNGKDVTGRSRGALVIDLFGLSDVEVRDRFPEVYQHVALRVRPDRHDQFQKSPTKDAADYLQNWWIFGKPRQALRTAIDGASRFIATAETSKHRTFQFFDVSVLPDNMLVVIASEDPAHLAILSSSLHVKWALHTGGRLGVGNDPRYSKSRCFDPFPFPAWTQEQHACLAKAGEEVDAFRRARLVELPNLTLTRLYNALAAHLAGCVPEQGFSNSMKPDEARDFTDASVVVLAELHATIDRLTLEAYGWSDLEALPEADREQALLARLVALNAERRMEEARGVVRWLRPEYQASRSRAKTAGVDDRQIDLEEVLNPTERIAWPRQPLPQLLLIKGALTEAEQPLSTVALIARFKGRKAAQDVPRLLIALERMGQVRAVGDGYMLLRVA